MRMNRWRNRKSQQWYYYPKDKTIRNKNWTSYFMDITNNGNSNDLRINSSSQNRWWQMFTMQGAYLVNAKGKVMEINQGKDNHWAELKVGTKNGNAIHQQWDIVYVEDWPEEPKKGELNKEYGMYVERPFYIVSQLATHRYLDTVDNTNLVIKHDMFNRNTQVWYFDQKSLSIRSKANNKCIRVKGNFGSS